MPVPSTATVFVPPSSAPVWAAVSMPRARPETTVIPAALRERAMLMAVSLPYREGDLVPTMATAGSISSREPLRYSTKGGSPVSLSSPGNPGSVIPTACAPAAFMAATAFFTPSGSGPLDRLFTWAAVRTPVSLTASFGAERRASGPPKISRSLTTRECPMPGTRSRATQTSARSISPSLSSSVARYRNREAHVKMHSFPGRILSKAPSLLAGAPGNDV